MPPGQGPTVTRRRLRAELRRLRLKKRLSIDEVANEVEWSTSKLIRIENGQVGITVSDMTALLHAYGATDLPYVDELKELARGSRQRMWWSHYQRFIAPGFAEFLGAETDAARTLQYQSSIVPGLLQTRAFAIAINRSTGFEEPDPETLEAEVDLRMRRQKEMLFRPDPVTYHAVLDEAALRRPVGGKATMRAQLDHLVEVGKRDNVTIAVLPFSVGSHIGVRGPFCLFEYDDPADDDVVYLENAHGGLMLRDQDTTVAQYKRVFAMLDGKALHDADAVDFLLKARKEFD